jgi:hypothetical protein
MTRNNHAIGREVQAPITLVMWRVPQEDVARRAGRQLMRHSRLHVRVASTPEDTKMVI